MEGYPENIGKAEVLPGRMGQGAIMATKELSNMNKKEEPKTALGPGTWDPTATTSTQRTTNGSE